MRAGAAGCRTGLNENCEENMTTLVDIFRTIDWVSILSTIQDKDSLQLMGRLTAAQRSGLEAQLAQMKQLEDAINHRIKQLK
jgi:hypothetical protein